MLRRGPGAAYFVPAHRALVDVALETRQYDRLLAAAGGARLPGRPLPEDSAAERAYLRGRVRYQRGDLAEAAAAVRPGGRAPRAFTPAAAYFRGLVAARRGAYRDARGAFCEILPGRAGRRLAFNIDGRYFQLQDLARLALGRIAHEQDRYDEAYYFYFSVPEDSERLAEALFEAAWSMYQKGEVRAARAFVEAFDQRLPRFAACGPRWPCCGPTSPCAPAPSTRPAPRPRPWSPPTGPCRSWPPGRRRRPGAGPGAGRPPAGRAAPIGGRGRPTPTAGCWPC